MRLPIVRTLAPLMSLSSALTSMDSRQPLLATTTTGKVLRWPLSNQTIMLVSPSSSAIKIISPLSNMVVLTISVSPTEIRPAPPPSITVDWPANSVNTCGHSAARAACERQTKDATTKINARFTVRLTTSFVLTIIAISIIATSP